MKASLIFGLLLVVGSASAMSASSIDVTAVPVPVAGILFAAMLLGAGTIGRRKSKPTKSSVTGIFTRAS